ncbi:hypothetical protein EDEG_01475 [Edhazardia aedis USNM 41457]|uniref:KRR-R motif-containing protein 1 n=1 Tax=Edhazardia aedis (strain USNM 41457) TaxID=1003232 RepID=J8ZX35_EDHAE|nr:hypothetical protein EDEG_01475 [Edhazardia aedis USNM 41457]|eukprot:EJW04243.1 hypothetical protein EDEG_01475 [Edhazardia aedis USNM 41457]
MKFKVPEFNDDDYKDEFTEQSEFTVVFPDWRKQYIKDKQEKIEELLTEKKLKLEVNYEDKILKVLTTNKTRDPYIIIKGRDFINLISRGAVFEEATKIFNDNVFCEVINIKQLAKSSNKAVFQNRKHRLEGKNGDTIKALQLLTKTYITMEGKSLCVVGKYKGINEVSDIVEKVFQNQHPVYLLKRLLAKRELENDKEIKDQDWTRLLPEVRSKMKNTRGDGKKKIALKNKIQNGNKDDGEFKGTDFLFENFEKKTRHRKKKNILKEDEDKLEENRDKIPNTKKKKLTENDNDNIKRIKNDKKLSKNTLECDNTSKKHKINDELQETESKI